jgi:hypothetical protein
VFLKIIKNLNLNTQLAAGIPHRSQGPPENSQTLIQRFNEVIAYSTKYTQEKLATTLCSHQNGQNMAELAGGMPFH